MGIFFEAFRDTVIPVYGDPPRKDAMLDVWAFAREIEPGAFLAARDASGLIGYVLFTSSVRVLQRTALLRGRPLVWGLRALSGRYGIRWLALGKALWNKMLFIGNENRFRTEGDAQLLNIAVAPAARGRGVAKRLVEAGMQYLRERGVPEVRLEVRPDNAAAIAVYRDTGYVERGHTRDVRGAWLVMTGQP